MLILRCTTPIIIVPAVVRKQQMRLFDLALDVAERQDSLINLLIEVHVDGSVEAQNWAKDSLRGG